MRTLNRIRQIALAAILTVGAAQASPPIADLGSMLVTAERSASVADLGAMTVMAPRDGRVADLGSLTVTARRLVTVAAERQAKRPIG